jgi:hypothetical protein
MSNNPFFSDAAAAAEVAAVGALCNTGTIKVYTGTQPADANTAITSQTLLGTFSFPATAFGTPSSSGTAPSRVTSANAGSISDITAVASGTAAWFRTFKSDGTTAVFDGSVGTSGCDLNLTDVSITSGEAMSISSFALSAPQ